MTLRGRPVRRLRRRLGRSPRTVRTRISCLTALEHLTGRTNHHRKLRHAACQDACPHEQLSHREYSRRGSSHATHPLRARASRRHPQRIFCAAVTVTTHISQAARPAQHSSTSAASSSCVATRLPWCSGIDIDTPTAAASSPRLGASDAREFSQVISCWTTVRRCCWRLSGFCGTARQSCHGARGCATRPATRR